eukprot:PLAT4781.2.p1 GENE.PLAT4781.2~~PLAT4781.2.p1  ORF type:complete len:399 (+),score=77.12 PLAT4781.2:3-1199(+)
MIEAGVDEKDEEHDEHDEHGEERKKEGEEEGGDRAVEAKKERAARTRVDFSAKEDLAILTACLDKRYTWGDVYRYLLSVCPSSRAQLPVAGRGRVLLAWYVPWSASEDKAIMDAVAACGKSDSRATFALCEARLQEDHRFPASVVQRYSYLQVRWTDDMDARLLRCVERYRGLEWRYIARLYRSAGQARRSLYALRFRYIHLLRTGRVPGTTERDDPYCSICLSRRAKLPSPSAITTYFTKKEEDAMMLALKQPHNSWSDITLHVLAVSPHRGDVNKSRCLMQFAMLEALKKPWTEEEDEALLAACHKHNRNTAAVSKECLPVLQDCHKDYHAVQWRVTYLLNDWTAEQDGMLLRMVAEHGVHDWPTVHSLLWRAGLNRSMATLRYRWQHLQLTGAAA